MEQVALHNLPQELKLKTVLHTDIGTIYFYGNIMIFEGNEGIVLSYKTGFSILLKCLRILKAKPWVYVSNRVNSYATKPIDFKYLNNVPTLKAIAVINHSDFGEMNSELEAKFCKKPFQTFNTVLEAANWAKTFL